jgi:hypothetical protein
MVCFVFEKKQKLTLGGRRRSVIYLEGAPDGEKGAANQRTGSKPLGYLAYTKLFGKEGC